MDVLDTDVLVVGAGPAGATAALALASYGVSAISLNKYGSTSPNARAHITNQRTMEILRDFGLERAAMDHATPHELMRDNIYATTLAGKELGRLEAWHTHPRFRMQHDLISPCQMVDLTQKLLEPLLVSAAATRGAKMRTDTELIDLVQQDSGVLSTVRDRLTGFRYQIRSRYLIGADGGNSRVVSLLGLPLEGRVKLAAAVGIEFRADLSRFIQHRPGVMYWFVQPTHGILGYSLGSLRMVRANDEWVANYGFDPAGPVPELSQDFAMDVVRRLIGDDTVPVEIERLDAYYMNQIHATQIRQGNVFAIGDAIHRHPPMNGLGSNTSIQDGYNLAWKLAMVLRGEAAESLLDSFQAERGPIAAQLVSKVMANMHVWKPLADSLGLSQHVQSQPELDALIALFEAPDSEGARRRAAFRDAMDVNLYGYSAIGGEFNILYDSGAIIADGRDLTVEDPELNVIFGMQSGRRLPHAWLTRAQERVSTLDLVGHSMFTVLTGLAGGATWRAATAQVSERLALELRIHVVGPGELHQDSYGDFAKLCLPDETGAILVRPDQVVGWHVDSLPVDPAEALGTALATLLGRDLGVSATSHSAASLSAVRPGSSPPGADFTVASASITPDPHPHRPVTSRSTT